MRSRGSEALLKRILPTFSPICEVHLKPYLAVSKTFGRFYPHITIALTQIWPTEKDGKIQKSQNSEFGLNLNRRKTSENSYLSYGFTGSSNFIEWVWISSRTPWELYLKHNPNTNPAYSSSMKAVKACQYVTSQYFAPMKILSWRTTIVGVFTSTSQRSTNATRIQSDKS